MSGLFGSEALELAIGIVLFFCLASLLCSVLRESLEAILKSRALDLERALRELLDDPDGTAAVKHLFDHPMVAGLFMGRYDPASLRRSLKLTGIGERLHVAWSRRRQLPSYIPSGQFADAFVDLVANGPATPAPYTFRQAGHAPVDLAALAAGAMALPSPKLRRVVLGAIGTGERDLAAVKARIESWYNGTMDRAAGWYKRRTQMLLFVLGLATAAGLNLDAVNVARHLLHDPALRQAAVSYAERTPASSPASGAAAQDVKTLRDTMLTIGLPIGWSVENVGALERCMPAPAQRAAAAGAPRAYICPSGTVTSTRAWTGATPAERYVLNLGDAGVMLTGWLATAIAIMLGAPFWFDVLNKIMIVRSTIKPEQKSGTEASPEPVKPAQPPLQALVAAAGAAGAAAHAPPAPALVFAAPRVPPSIPNRWRVGDDPEAGIL